MSTSDAPTDFEPWLVQAFDAGAFTALIVLLRIRGTEVAPLCSTYVNVIGPEVAWGEMVVMLAGSGQDWDGVAFYPERDGRGRPLDNPTARTRLRLLESRIDADRLVLNEGHFFDRWGRRMRIDEVPSP